VSAEQPHLDREPGAGASAAGREPSEEELRAAYEQELSRITSADLMLQAVVSLLNLGGRRLGVLADAPAGSAEGRDLEQVRDAIDGVRALLAVLERRFSKELAPLRDALSQLQIAYTREAQAGAGGAGAATDATVGGAQTGARPEGAPEEQTGAGGERQSPPGPGPAESSGRLWVPGR
jgi:hypothetical protein